MVSVDQQQGQVHDSNLDVPLEDIPILQCEEITNLSIQLEFYQNIGGLERLSK